MTGNQPTRTNQGGNQSKGGNYENPGGNSTGTMGTQYGNEELSRVVNNGGGPEPHQGSNPGAQSDPGPKEIGFYDQLSNHVLGDDGIQSNGSRQSPMGMGGIEGAQPNPGQRGGQNTGTSGAQTATNYSSEEEYGAGSIPGVTGSRGGNAATGERYSGGLGNEALPARAASNGGGGSMGRETRNPVGFAADMTAHPQATHVPGHGAQSVASDAQADRPNIMHDSRPGYEPGDFANGAGAGTRDDDHVYQSRAAQMLVDMRRDSPTTYSHEDGA